MMSGVEMELSAQPLVFVFVFVAVRIYCESTFKEKHLLFHYMF